VKRCKLCRKSRFAPLKRTPSFFTAENLKPQPFLAQAQNAPELPDHHFVLPARASLRPVRPALSLAPATRVRLAAIDVPGFACCLVAGSASNVEYLGSALPAAQDLPRLRFAVNMGTTAANPAIPACRASSTSPGCNPGNPARCVPSACQASS
jgi:hypothetical protein